MNSRSSGTKTLVQPMAAIVRPAAMRADPWITKMYYHRAYNLRKNTLDPKLGRMQWKTQAEGRWRSGWYPNVISYGGGHQVRESRWLRDPSYALGHVRTFAENEKPDGVYPSHVKPAGPGRRTSRTGPAPAPCGAPP